MTSEQLRSVQLLRSRRYGGKALEHRYSKDTGGKRFRYLKFTAQHGWRQSEHNPWRVASLPEGIVN